MAVVVPIDADVSGLTRKIGAATSSLGGFGKMAAWAAGAAALGGLVATVKVGVDEFMQAEKVTAQTNAVLKSTAGAANVSAREIDALAQSIMRKSGMDDESVKSAENLLLTFTKVRNEAGAGNDVFNQATRVTADLSVALGKDLNSSAMMVGKALNDPIKGLSSLGRAGVQFTAAQKDQIKAMVESGDVMGAQKKILKELETQVGGSADAYGKTLPGKLSILRETFNNVAGDLVATFMPKVAQASQSVLEFVRKFQARPTLNAKIDLVIGTIKDAVGASFSSLLDWWLHGKTEIQRGKNNELSVTVTLSGKDQVAGFFDGLTATARRYGDSTGVALAEAIDGGLSSKGKKKITNALNTVFSAIGDIAYAVSAGQIIAVNFLTAMVDVLDKRLGPALKEKLVSAFNFAADFLTGNGDARAKVAAGLNSLVQGAAKEVRNARFVPLSKAMKERIQDAFRNAVQEARQNLQSLGGSVGDMVGEIIGRASGGGSAIRARMKERQDARDEARLRDAVANAQTDEERKKAQDDLQDYLDGKEADRLDAEVEKNKAASKQKFDDLIAAFNTGAIDLSTFQTNVQGLLSEYIGPDYGATLGSLMGTSFTTSFTQTLNALLSQASFLPTGTPGIDGPSVVDPAGIEESTRREERERQYQTAHEAWLERRRAYREKLIGTKKDGKRVYDAAEVTRMMSEWEGKPKNREPKRADYQLATGGILTRPRYLAGEAGNEAVIPLGSPTAAQMMRKAFSDAVGGGASTTINISVTAGMGADGANVGRLIVEEIKKYERRNGPVFVGA